MGASWVLPSVTSLTGHSVSFPIFLLRRYIVSNFFPYSYFSTFYYIDFLLFISALEFLYDTKCLLFFLFELRFIKGP